MKLDPVEVCFAEKKEEPGQAKQDSCTISVNVGKRNLYLITVSGHMTQLPKAMFTALLFEHTQMTAAQQGTAIDGDSSPCCFILLSAQQSFAGSCCLQEQSCSQATNCGVILRMKMAPDDEHHHCLSTSTLEGQHVAAVRAADSL